MWGVPVDHEFTVRNDGGGPATMAGSAGAMGTGFSWKDGTYPGTGGDCGAMLAIGATCKLVVTFTPSGPATLFGQVRVAYNDGGATRTAIRAMIGTPTARAHVTVAEFFGPNNCSNCMPFDFGAVAVGHSLEHMFTVYNTGALPASLTPAVGLTAPFAYKAPRGAIRQRRHLRIDARRRHLVPAGRRVRAADRGDLEQHVNLGYDDTFVSPQSASRAITGSGL